MLPFHFMYQCACYQLIFFGVVYVLGRSAGIFDCIGGEQCLCFPLLVALFNGMGACRSRLAIFRPSSCRFPPLVLGGDGKGLLDAAHLNVFFGNLG